MLTYAHWLYVFFIHQFMGGNGVSFVTFTYFKKIKTNIDIACLRNIKHLYIHSFYGKKMYEFFDYTTVNE